MRTPLRQHGLTALLALALAVLGWTTPGRAWVLALADSVVVPAGRVTLADVTVVPPPPAVADLVLAAGLAPGRRLVVTRRGVLRELSLSHRAGDVVCQGAATCTVVARGMRVGRDALAAALLDALADWLPRGEPGAPPAGLELVSETPSLQVGDRWRLELVEPRRLQPGRNLVRAAVASPEGRHVFTATVVCHQPVPVPRAVRDLAKGQLLTPDLLAWSWEDAAVLDRDIVQGRGGLDGVVVRRPVAAGQPLRRGDIALAPLVRQGERVELILRRGAVAVTTSGVARQDGVRDQLIYVRNELDGRLIKGRVTGPGRVAWGR